MSLNPDLSVPDFLVLFPLLCRMTLTDPHCPVHAGQLLSLQPSECPGLLPPGSIPKKERTTSETPPFRQLGLHPWLWWSPGIRGAFMNTSSRMIRREPQPSQACAHRQGLPQDAQGLLDLQPSPGVCVAQPRPSDQQ